MRKHLSKILLLAAALCLLLTGCGKDRESAEPLPEDPAGQSEQAGAAEGGGQTYTDNFSVDPADAEAFAQKIQAAAADRDLEGLADLMMFPNYVGFPEDVQFVDTREEFLALGADRVFTEDLLTEVSTADITSLEPSQAGFILSVSGCPNIIFGVADGSLAIVGINY